MVYATFTSSDVSAGLVVAGAGLIAVVPVGAPALDIQTRAVQLASVENVTADVLSAAAVLWEFWSAEIVWLGVSDPTPILTAIMDNQVIYANDLATAAENGGANLVNALQEFLTVLSNALSEAASGDEAVPEALRADPPKVC